MTSPEIAVNRDECDVEGGGGDLRQACGGASLPPKVRARGCPPLKIVEPLYSLREQPKDDMMRYYRVFANQTTGAAKRRHDEIL